MSEPAGSPCGDGAAKGDLDDLVRISYFAEMGKAFAGVTTLRETFRVAMKHIGEIFAPTHWSLFLRDGKTGDLTFAVVVGTASGKLSGRRLPRGTGIAGWIAERQEALIIQDVSTDPRFDPEADRSSGFETRSIIGVPLVFKGRTFGVIELVNKLNGQSFSPLELKMLTVIADFTAIAIEKSYYFSALRRLAVTDELTRLPNRRGILKALQREQDRSSRGKSVYSVLFFDIDKFKYINDTFGHAEGDRVLVRLARILQKETRAVDTPARYGGDEFLVLLPDTDRAKARDVAARIVAAVERSNTGEAATMSVSVGVEECDGSNFEELLRRVDAGMYGNKQLKSDFSFPEMDQNLTGFYDDEDETE